MTTTVPKKRKKKKPNKRRSGRLAAAHIVREMQSVDPDEVTLRSLRLFAAVPGMTLESMAQAWPEGAISRQAMAYIEDRKITDTSLKRLMLYAQTLEIPCEVFIEWYTKIFEREAIKRLP